MSLQLIQHYYAQVEKIIRYGGSRNEATLRNRKPIEFASAISRARQMEHE